MTNEIEIRAGDHGVAVRNDQAEKIVLPWSVASGVARAITEVLRIRNDGFMLKNGRGDGILIPWDQAAPTARRITELARARTR